MPPENRNAAEDPFRELETQLADLRTTAKSLREDRPSWADNVFHPGRWARKEADLAAALAAALKTFLTSVRQTMAQQQSKLADLEREIPDVQPIRHELEQLREQHERLVKQQADAGNRTNELQQRIEQLGNDYASKIEQLAAGQSGLTNEFRERLQNLLDEQRVSIRQLSLKASEDAVLSDRARRATELKLEELAKRLPPA